MIKQELTRLKKAFYASCHGLIDSWKDGGAFRTEIVLTPVIIIGAIFTANSNLACILIIVCWFVILIAELLNTGIEASTDLVCDKKIHPLAKKAKDAASAAVLCALIMFIIVWMLVILFNI